MSEEFAAIQDERAMENAANINGGTLQLKKEWEKELARERKRKQHAREKELEVSNGIWSSDGALKKVSDMPVEQHIWRLYWPLYKFHKQKLSKNDPPKPIMAKSSAAAANLNSEMPEALRPKPVIKWRWAKWSNWLKPDLWKQIDAAAKSCQFCTKEMVKLLKLQLGGDVTFQHLTAGTILHWIDYSGEALRWGQHTLERVDSQGKQFDSGKTLGWPQMLVSMISYIPNSVDISPIIFLG